MTKSDIEDRLRECEQYILHVDKETRDVLLGLKVKPQPNQEMHEPKQM